MTLTCASSPTCQKTIATTSAGGTPDEWFLFHPTQWPQGDWQPQHLQFTDVFFNAEDGTNLHGWYCPVEEPNAVILFAHGNAGHLAHRSWLLQFLTTELQVSVMIFDYRGYGRSDGTATVEGVLQDARAARTHLARQAGIQESEIVLMGRSLGGAVMVQLASEAPPRGLILESTFSSLRDVADALAPNLAWIVPEGKLDSASSIQSYQGPLLQSHGDADQTIPYASGRKLYDAAAGPKEFVIIAGGDHNDGQGGPYYEKLLAFLHGLPSSP
ncbi:MAG: alpha/beta hydrolase [Planctomycetota bacterium]